MTEESHHSLLNCLQRLPNEDNTDVQNACRQHHWQTWQISLYHGCAMLLAKAIKLQVRCLACFTALLSKVADRRNREGEGGGCVCVCVGEEGEGVGGGGRGGVENDDLRLQPID